MRIRKYNTTIESLLEGHVAVVHVYTMFGVQS